MFVLRTDGRTRGAYLPFTDGLIHQLCGDGTIDASADRANDLCSLPN